VWEEENEEYEKRGLEELGNKAGYTRKEVKEPAAALTERIEQLEAAVDGKVKKNFRRL
jgi:hypothetical protein